MLKTVIFFKINIFFYISNVLQNDLNSSQTFIRPSLRIFRIHQEIMQHGFHFPSKKSFIHPKKKYYHNPSPSVSVIMDYILTRGIAVKSAAFVY